MSVWEAREYLKRREGLYGRVWLAEPFVISSDFIDGIDNVVLVCCDPS